MSVGHCDDDYGFTVNAVNQCVRELSEQASSNLWRDFGESNWIGSDESNDTVQRVKEIQTFSLLSLFKPEDSLIDFLSCECEEPDVHLPLY